METIKGPNGHSSAPRVGGFCLFGASVVYTLLGGFFPSMIPIMLPMAQGAMWAGVTVITGGKVTESLARK